MKSASRSDKALIIDILCQSFDDNTSINFIVRQDHKRTKRIRQLMDYCFEMCMLQGQAFLNEERNGCVLILDSVRKAGWLNNFILDTKLALNAIGLLRIGKILNREKQIKAHQPKEPFYYLWFIGVQPEYQGQGIGSKLLGETLQFYESTGKPFYLETSVVSNLPWYQKYGFKIINEIDIGYKLYQMIRS